MLENDKRNAQSRHEADLRGASREGVAAGAHQRVSPPAAKIRDSVRFSLSANSGPGFTEVDLALTTGERHFHWFRQRFVGFPLWVFSALQLGRRRNSGNHRLNFCLLTQMESAFSIMKTFPL